MTEKGNNIYDLKNDLFFLMFKNMYSKIIVWTVDVESLICKSYRSKRFVYY